MIALVFVCMSAAVFFGFLLGVVMTSSSMREHLEDLRAAEIAEREAQLAEARNRKSILLAEVLQRHVRKPEMLQ